MEKRIIEIETVSSEDLLGQESVQETERTDTKAGVPAESVQERKSVYDLLEEEIMDSEIPDAVKTKRLSRLLQLRGQKVNIMLVGATGSGKSSTINALFNMEVAKVGVGADPETADIAKFEFDNLTIWDTPGLGDGVENDKQITKGIIKKLNEMDELCNPLIDMVVVILDASSKDLGTSYDLINKVLIPCFGKEAAKERILLALNQCDLAMKGAHWDAENNEPDEVLKEFLEKKVASVQNRIREGTGLDLKPVYYCAGFKEEGQEQKKPYNLTKLFSFLVKAIPRDKRLALADHINEDEENWVYDDREADYCAETRLGFCNTIWDCVSDGLETGAEIGGGLLGIPGKIVGGVIGSAVGAVKGIFSAIFR